MSCAEEDFEVFIDCNAIIEGAKRRVVPPSCRGPLKTAGLIRLAAGTETVSFRPVIRASASGRGILRSGPSKTPEEAE